MNNKKYIFNTSNIVILFILITVSICHAATINELINNAQIHIQRKDYGNAIKNLAAALKKKPDSFEINYLMGLSQYKNKKHARAIKYLTAAFEIKEEYECGFLLGNAHYELEHWESALKTFEDVEKAKSTPDVYVMLAQTSKMLKDIKKTIEYYHEVIEIDKKHVASYLELGKLYIEMNDYKEAREILKDGKRNNPESVELNNSYKNIQFSENIEKAEELIKSERYSEALKYLNNILKREPENFNALIKKANVLYLVSKLEDALEILRELRKQGSSRTEVYKLFGMVYNGLENYSDAIKNLKIVVSKKKNDFQAHYQLGYSYEKKKAYKLAEQEYKNAIKAKQSFGKSYIGLARIYIEKKDYEKTEINLKKAQKYGEKNLENIIKKATGYKFVKSGEKFFDQKNYTEALKNYEEALSYIDAFEIYISMANCAQELKKSSTALQYLRKADSMNPDNYKVMMMMMEIYKSKNMEEQYNLLFNKISELKKSDPEIWINIGLINEEKKDYDGAEKAYKEALKIDPENNKTKFHLSTLYYNKAVKQYNVKNWDAADVLADKALSFTTEFYDAEKLKIEIRKQKAIILINSYIKSADLYMKKREYKEVVGFYLKILELNPDLVKIQLKLCNVYVLLGAYEMAEEILKPFLSDNIQNPIVLELAANLRYSKEDYIKALEYGLEALKIKPDANSYNTVGKIYMKKEEFDKAKKSFKKALSIDSDFIEASINYGNVLFKEGSYSLAEVEYHKVLKAFPKDSVALHNLGIIYFNKGKYTASLNYFKTALQYQKNFHGIYYGVGRAQYYLGIYNEARINIEKAYEMKQKIIYNWALGLVYSKLIKRDKNYLQKAIEHMEICVRNIENDDVSVLARESLVEISPDKEVVYKNRYPFKAVLTPVVAGDKVFYYSELQKGILCKDFAGETILWKNLNLSKPKIQYIFGDKFYFAGTDNKIYALNPYSGITEWQFKVNASKLFSYDKGLLLLNNNDELVMVTDGIQKWAFKLEIDSIENLSIKYYENSILCSTRPRLNIINAESGKEEWVAKRELLISKIEGSAGTYVISKCTIDGLYLHAILNINKTSYLVSVNRLNNTISITKKLPAEAVSEPLIEKNTMIIVLKNGNILSMNKQGKEFWRNDIKQKINACYIHEDTLFLTTDAEKIFSLNVSNGKIKWSTGIEKAKDSDYVIIYKGES